ncbi:MAG: 5-(carboxyamino)imidazole ribonucleotide synthase [Candidatus Nitronauta litoralis]|uniref:N5-carboxyaminoimidazole ribonucleotide synthase n=1 Tax=Candidatus Nitronauta litoralis TaxID=2705533 RepID=A0A7T0BX01_9BACT|nr:MAG: 5-(carboxyamino)imidazole ribonucleotide synthase [Candidatus Nitronauta litoralis]
MNIGILGGGQLARMMAQAGSSLQLGFMFLSPDPHAPAAPFGEHLCASYDDKSAQERLVQWADVVTYEFENIPLPLVESLEQRIPLHPASSVLAVARDRLSEKNLFRSLGIQTAKFAPVDNLEMLRSALKDIGFPAILKFRTQGYDGKGQAWLRKESDSSEVWGRVGKVPCILESMVPFCREISIIAARNQQGDMVFYPVTENHHRDGILRLSISRPDDSMQAEAESKIRKIMEHLSYVGVMALELFHVENELFANELAPRVHNSGHWTIEGAETSQFENHLRAISQLPLGKTSSTDTTAMVNLIGHLPGEAQIGNIRGATLHSYDKSERPGRKVGHVTLTSGDCSAEEFDQRLEALLQLAGEAELASQKIL